MPRPPSITLAVQAIWLTNAVSALLIIANSDAADASTDGLVFNCMLLGLYVLVTVKIGAGRNWARLSYAFLVALECAALAAFGLDQASDWEAVATYLTLPLEFWVLYKLFDAIADAWFAAGKPDKP